MKGGFMNRFRLYLSIVCTFMLLSVPVLAQANLDSVLPIYPGANLSSLAGKIGESAVVTTTDDVKAVMIFFRKMLAYRGWEVVSGSVLKCDPIIRFIRNGQRLTMQTDSTAAEKPSRIVFTLQE